MTIQRMEHIGIQVDKLAAATVFFVELANKLLGAVAKSSRRRLGARA